jgi:murein DD-endopeptidase MepM/ murein hydrolase activator NlpD
VNSTVNAGTAGIQQLMALLYNKDNWLKSVQEEGIYKTYNELFGYPFDYGIESLIPPDLKQPTFQLPFEPQITWSFTGGPHPAYGDGSAWAALDFAPPGDAPGCVDSEVWVTAVANGLVTKSENGIVDVDLDGDGFTQIGWSVLYLHVATKDRIASGESVKAGDRIGHPSCEGGVSNGTHLHLARRYNGMWISADGKIPFILDGWTSSGTGTVYDGLLVKNDVSIEAWNGRREENQIHR